MDFSRNSCRICASESKFNVSLFGDYCLQTGMIDKILMCLDIVIEETDTMNTICFKCAGEIERYYDFIMNVKQVQNKMAKSRQGASVSRPVPSYVTQRDFDHDETFSFMNYFDENEKKPEQSSTLFSYFSLTKEKKPSEVVWKTPHVEKRDKFVSQRQKEPRKQECSRDLFDSLSQEAEDPKLQNWRSLTPVENILKQVKQKCFGRSDF